MSDPSSMAGQTLPERGNLIEHTSYEKDNTGVKLTSKASENVDNPCDSVALVHHRGDNVCNVELVPVRKRKLQNVLTRMKDERLRGPLAVMRRCMTENIKVKVITRNYKHVRGICTGYILAFDKHWNLALKDVDEVYKNPLPKPTAKRKKRQRKTKEKHPSEEALPGDKDEKVRNPTSDSESAADLLGNEFVLTDASSAEDDADSCQELEGKFPASVEILEEKRRCILERLHQLPFAQNSASTYEEDEAGKVKRRSNVVSGREKRDLVSRDERRSSTSSATGSRDRKRSRRTARVKEPYEQSKKRGSRSVNSDLSFRDRRLRDAECGIIEKKDLLRKKSSAQNQMNLKGTSSHQEPVGPVMHNTERRDPEILPQNNPHDCDSQKIYQSWLVRHVNQLFIRGDNVVLVSINET